MAVYGGRLEGGPAEDAADTVPHFTVTVTLAFLPFAVFTVIVTLPFFTALTSVCLADLIQ